MSRAFLAPQLVPLRHSLVTHSSSTTCKRPSSRPPFRFCHTTKACAPTPTDDSAPQTVENPPLIPEANLPKILTGTMLADEPLATVFNSSNDAFDNDAFFNRMIPLGGVPSLVLGRTMAGVTFGGYTANGFLARDDYREASTDRSMFVFRIDENGDVLVAENTDPIQYDFYDYAIRFGSALLGIPMNPSKHLLKSNTGKSSCRLPSGESSVFGDATIGTIETLQVWVAKRYVDEVQAKKAKAGNGFFKSLFGLTLLAQSHQP